MKDFSFDDEQIFFIRRSVIRLKNSLKADLVSYLNDSDQSSVDGCIHSISVLNDLLSILNS